VLRSAYLKFKLKYRNLVVLTSNKIFYDFSEQKEPSLSNEMETLGKIKIHIFGLNELSR